MGVWDGLGDVEKMARLLVHPAHGTVARALHELIVEYRTAVDRSELRQPQEHLAAALSEAERLFGEARRAQKKGSGDDVDVAFWRATCVRLRAIGDAAAWKFLNFRRQWILLMGRNQHPGHVTMKDGFANEWQLFQEHWDAGEPTLLTGLTNSITLGDLLVARDDVLWTIEVKRNLSHSKRQQTDRLRQLQRQLMGVPRIDGPDGVSWVHEVNEPYRSFWSEADVHIERAMKDGFAAWVPSPGVGILFSSVAAAGIERDMAEVTLNRERDRAGAILGPATHRILVHSYNFPYRSSRTAPFGIFPIKPEYASLLLAGELVFTVELRIERYLEELRRVGFDAKHPIPEDGPEGPLPRDIAEWRRGRDRGVLHASAVEQLAIELLDPTVWADGIAQSFTPPGPERRWGSYVCFAGESEAWR